MVFMKINEHLIQLLLSAIIGIASLGVSYMRDMSKEIQTISAAVLESRAESAIKFGQLTEIVKDHEARLRAQEIRTHTRR
jgi:hypothetical protein